MWRTCVKAALFTVCLHAGSSAANNARVKQHAFDSTQDSYVLEEGPHSNEGVLFQTYGEDGEMEVRRLLADHDDVPTDTPANNSNVEADWAHDYSLLKPILEERGYDTGGSTRLCELPRVYCDYGYRRRVPTYGGLLMGDWVGHKYQVILNIKNESLPNQMHPDIFNLRRIGYFDVAVGSGPWPPGIEKLTSLAVLWIEGTRSAGIEGGLPPNFWSFKSRMFLMGNMGPAFTGQVEPVLPCCAHLDYRLFMYNMPNLGGVVDGFHACDKLDRITIYSNPMLGGNPWYALLGKTSWFDYMGIGLGSFSGPIPNGNGGPDPWVEWCRGHADSGIRVWIEQTVNGPMPAGLAECKNVFSMLAIANNAITGSFPIDLSNNSLMLPDRLDLSNNKFTGPIPEIPPQLTEIHLERNRWTGDLPVSWQLAVGITELDLEDCDRTEYVNITPSIKSVKMAKNRLSGPVPDSWLNASLTTLDLSNNEIVGPPFSWGWGGFDWTKGVDPNELAAAYKSTPSWPLQTLRLNNNPLGMNVNFLVFMTSYYSLAGLFLRNCSLTGFMTDRAPDPQRPLPGGGVSRDSRDIGYGALKILDLSENYITGLSFNDEQATPNLCWEWHDYFPVLEKLYLQDCPALRHVAHQIYDTPILDIRGTPSLMPQHVVQDKAACEGVFGVEDASCSGYNYAVCLYRVAVYSQIGETHRECADLGAVVQSGEKRAVLVDELFDVNQLCRCLPGFEPQEGAFACKHCGKDTFRTKDMDVCEACPEFSSTAGDLPASSIFDCLCSPGHYMFVSPQQRVVIVNATSTSLPAGLCEGCPLNTYSATTGATSIRACADCPPGTVTGSMGSDNISSCVCPAGYQEKPNQQRVCEMCSQGKYKVASGMQTCTPCGRSAEGVQLTTRFSGSASLSDCACPPGTYAPAVRPDACVTCPDGMQCDQVNTSESAILLVGGFSNDFPFPVAPEGYMTLPSKPMLSYKCKERAWCPGGLPGKCNFERDGNTPGCGSCPEGFYTQPDGMCGQCTGSSFGGFLAFASIIVVVAITAYILLDDCEAPQPPRAVVATAIVAALSLVATQNLGVMPNMTIRWSPSVNPFFRGVSATTGSLDILRIECAVGQNIESAYVVRQLIPIILSVLCIVVTFIKKRFVMIDMKLLPQIVNVVGIGYNSLFVSVLLSITLPYVCYPHPGSAGYSMVSSPSILCFQGGLHDMLLAWSVVSVFVNAVPFIALLIFAVFKYKSMVSSKIDAPKYLLMFKFLFVRYRPDCYYFSFLAILRSTLVCMVPVIFRDSKPMQIFMMTAVFLCFSMMIFRIRPWRADGGNLADGALTALMVLLLICAAMFTNFDEGDATDIIAGLSVFIVILMFGIALVVIVWNIYQFFRPQPFYKWLIVHNANDDAARTRFLQLQLGEAVKDTCAVNSDTTNYIDSLDLVECRCSNVVVMLTANALRALCCAGEIATAYMRWIRVSTSSKFSPTRPQPIRMFAIVSPTFVKPLPEELSPIGISTFIEPTSVRLAEVGITDECISKAYSWLFSSDVQRFSYPTNTGTKTFRALANTVRDTASLMDMGHRQAKTVGVTDSQPDLQEGMVLISSTFDDMEATAAAGILSWHLTGPIAEISKPGLCALVDMAHLPYEDIFRAVCSAHAVLFVLSQATLKSAFEVKIIMHCLASGIEVVPTFLPTFRMPSEQFMENLGDTSEGAIVARYLTVFFEKRASPLFAHTSLELVRAQCQVVCDRVPRERKVAKPDNANLLDLSDIDSMLHERIFDI